MRHVKDMTINEIQYISRDIMHCIKYNDVKGYNWIFHVDSIGIEKYTNKQMRNMCILATFIQEASRRAGMTPPDWVLDKRLFMPKAYLSKEATEMDIFEAFQAEFDHNVFFPKYVFDVI